MADQNLDEQIEAQVSRAAGEVEASETVEPRLDVVLRPIVLRAVALGLERAAEIAETADNNAIYDRMGAIAENAKELIAGRIRAEAERLKR